MEHLSKLSVRSQFSFDQLFHGVNAQVSALCFSPDGRWLCGVCWNSVRVWEIPTGRLAGEFKGSGLAFTPEGELAYALWDEEKCEYWIEVLELPSCKVVSRFVDTERNVYMLAVSPDGKTFAGGGYQEVHVWDRKSGIKLWSFPTYPRITMHLMFAPDGTKLITRSFGNMAVWSLVGDRLATLGNVQIGAENDSGGGLAISCDGLIASAVRKGVELRSLTGEPIARWDDEHLCGTLAFSQDGKVLAVSYEEDKVMLINVESKEVMGTLKGSRGTTAQLAWSPDGTLASAGNGKVNLWSDQPVGDPLPKPAPARADDGDISERLGRIREKIARHRLKLRPAVALDEVEAFETKHGVILPEGFRRFITEIGNGGDGPPSYGFVPLMESLEHYGSVVNLKALFPLTESCCWEEEDEPKRTESLSAAWDGGHLYIGDDGCGMTWMLIVSGPERGHIWQLCGMGASATQPRRDFLSWYEYWLDGGDDYWGLYESEEAK